MSLLDFHFNSIMFAAYRRTWCRSWIFILTLSCLQRTGEPDVAPRSSNSVCAAGASTIRSVHAYQRSTPKVTAARSQGQNNQGQGHRVHAWSHSMFTGTLWINVISLTEFPSVFYVETTCHHRETNVAKILLLLIPCFWIYTNHNFRYSL